jgi:hypothetical protein
MKDILKGDWLKSVSNEQRSLIEISIDLYNKELASKNKRLTDYSFIVFSMSKAYEGFLKEKFLELGLIDNHTYEGRRFRIGRSLNPDVHEKSRDKYWLYDDLEEMCGAAMAKELWDSWLVCRNKVFHYFPKAQNFISLETAGDYLFKLSSAMKSLVECQIKLEEHEQKLKMIYNN